MPAAIQVNKEEVRMLVLNLGVREAARQCGLNENTVLDWSRSGQWLAETRPTPAKLPPPASLVGPISPIKPVDALERLMREDAKSTKVDLTRYAARMAKQAADGGTLEEAPLLKAVAYIHGKMHPEQAQVGIALNFFSVSQDRDVEHPVIDVEQA